MPYGAIIQGIIMASGGAKAISPALVKECEYCKTAATENQVRCQSCGAPFGIQGDWTPPPITNRFRDLDWR